MLESLNNQKKESKKLKDALIRAEESDRLKTAFLRNLSHEIRTLLNSIMGFSDVLKEEELDLEDVKEYTKHIVKGSNRLLNTVTDILNISLIQAKQEKLQYTTFKAEALLENLSGNSKAWKTLNQLNLN